MTKHDPGYPAVISQLAVTLTRFIFGWDRAAKIYIVRRKREASVLSRLDAYRWRLKLLTSKYKVYLIHTEVSQSAPFLSKSLSFQIEAAIK